jgi:ABC-type glycerol-3-phosphate transport system substrate-binding protein
MARLLAIVLVISLWASACGRGGASTPPLSAEPVTLSFATTEDSRDSYVKLIDEFHKLHPEVTVEIMSQGSPGASMEMTCVNCDVVRVAVGELTPERIADFRPLDDLIAGDSASRNPFPSKDLSGGGMEALQFEGKQLAVPAGIDPIQIFYNPDLFKAGGVAPPAANWTLDNFVQAAQKVTSAPDAEEVTYGYCPRPDTGDVAIFTYLMGGQLVDNLVEPTRPTLDTPENRKALDWFADLRRVHQVMPSQADIQQQFGDIFRAMFMGRCGMWLGFLSDRARFEGFYSDTGRSVPGVLPLPQASEQFAVAGIDAYAILKNSQKAKVAWEWIKFVLDHSEAASPLLPPRSSQLKSQEYANVAGKEKAALAKGLPERLLIWDSRLASPALAGTVGAFMQAAESVANGDAESGPALADAQAQAEAAFEQ